MEALPVRPLPVLMLRLPERPKTVNTSGIQQCHKSKSQTLEKIPESGMRSLLDRFDGNAGNVCCGVVCAVGRGAGERLVARNVGVDGARPGVDAASEGLGVGETLV